MATNYWQKTKWGEWILTGSPRPNGNNIYGRHVGLQRVAQRTRKNRKEQKEMNTVFRYWK